MVNVGKDFWPRCAILALAACLLTAAAWNRGPEYDEQYTLFITSHTPRPVWPDTVFPAGDVVQARLDHASLGEIADNLRRTDVHPPLYFWIVAGWRWVVGDGLFAIRLLSVGFALGTLGVVSAIARHCGIAAAPAMMVTLGCYGFAYTGAVARGFALASLLTLLGTALTMTGRRHVLAGALLGAAALTNYLAVFAAGAVLLLPRAGRVWRIAGFLPFIAAAGWFFLAQRASRSGQFPPFELLPAVARLARFWAANLAGGLPLYVGETWRLPLSLGLAGGIAWIGCWVVWRWRQIGTGHTKFILAAASLAPPLGLLGLGLIFNNTPIELRYLSYSAPFIALLVAGAVPRQLLVVVCTVQMASLAGLINRPETMQPMGATTQAAVVLAGNGVVLVPRGNDGVGIVSSFASLAPPTMPILIIGPQDTAEQIKRRVAGYDRVVLALLGVDLASQAALPAMRAAFAGPEWQADGEGFNTSAFRRIPDKP